MRKRMILGICVLAATGVLAQTSSIGGPTPSPASSLERISSYLSRTEDELGLVPQSIQEGKATAAEGALNDYTRLLSRLHVEVAALRAGKEEDRFLRRVVERLKVQKSRLDSITENGQPELKAALNEARNHVSSILQVAEERLYRRGRARVRSYGPRAVDPTGSRSRR